MQETSMSRRSFVAGASAAVAGAVAASQVLSATAEEASAAQDAQGAAHDRGEWDYEADVIVVGTGPAGVACAAAAAEAGVSVIAIDANDKIGGKGILAAATSASAVVPACRGGRV